MTSRARAVTLLAVVAFVAFLLWSTLSSQRAECSVTVDFGGRRGSASASAASAADAEREAMTAACGPLTSSMNDRVACAATPPAARRCRTL
jgi:hypothetical protein